MKYVVKKLIALIITLFAVSVLAFFAFQIISGDPTTKMLGTEATPEAIAALRAELGLDRNVVIRYLDWLFSFLQGDFGMSYNYRMPVSQMLADKLPISVLLTFMGFGFTMLLSIPLGLLAGSIRSKILDRAFAVSNQVVMSIPAFFIGILVCYFFGTLSHLFVPGNFTSYTVSWKACITYLIFPALSIAIPRIAMTVKLLRASILDQQGLDYVRTAKSRGCNPTVILLRHVTRNAMVPVVTFLAVSAAEIMTGSIIIEQIFTVPGIGRLLLASISNRDFPVVQAIVVLMASWIVLVNFLADILNQFVDPRIRL